MIDLDDVPEVIVRDLLERVEDDCVHQDFGYEENVEQYGGNKYARYGYDVETVFATPNVTVRMEIEYHSPSDDPLSEIHD